MADIRPFKGIRPAKNLADRVAALPYDVYNREEAKQEALKDRLSFLNIDRPESQFSDDFDMYDLKVYEKAKEMLNAQIDGGVYVADKTANYYIYELEMSGKCQTGIVAVSSIDDYLNNVIKKHENTREEKEQDRINHVDICNAQTGPIFLTYRAVGSIDELVSEIKKNEPEYNFVSDDGVAHRVWIVDCQKDIEFLITQFAGIDSIYIADGHHRAASAVKVGLKRRQQNPGYNGDEEFNYFLSVLFPDNQLNVMDYNRVVKDLNGYEKEEFLAAVGDKFIIERQKTVKKPKYINTFGMYLDGDWYLLKAKPEILSSDPVEGLDVSILQNYILSPILGIEDPRTDERIDFIGGIRGLGELEKRCGEDMRVAFAMYPTTMGQLFAVSDAELLMPPKSTWFEPKLRSGLFIHSLE